MKRLYYIAALLGLLSTGTMMAQEPAQGNTLQQRRGPEASRGAREQEKPASTMPELTQRAQSLNDRMTQEIGNARWMRVIYREIDLTKEKNAPLYYPTRPLNGQMNLFTTIFRLMSEGKLEAYEYIPDYEIFDEDHIVKFKDVLDRTYIYYEEVPGRAGEAPSYIINEADIPAADVQAYYVKEAWYFDQNNSVFDVKTLAICPIITTTDDYGVSQTMALFWLPYENIRPYINNTYVMTSSINNAKTFTMDDYFRRRLFEGEIIKTENLMNKTLQQMYPETDSLQLAQKQIETQLTDFQKSLWMNPDSMVTATTDPKKAAKQATVSTRSSGSTTKQSAPKVSTPKPASTTPVRSVRRTR